MKSSGHLTRFEIDSSRFDNGQLLISGRGLAGETFKDLLFVQPHDAASRRPKGASGVTMASCARYLQIFERIFPALPRTAKHIL